jgi:hypothetical protein
MIARLERGKGKGWIDRNTGWTGRQAGRQARRQAVVQDRFLSGR